MAWSTSTTADEVNRRAGGRRHYNSVRRFRAMHRRYVIAKQLHEGEPGMLFRHGTQARLARELGVSRATICRDMAALTRLARPCPHCGAFVFRQDAHDAKDPDLER